jgi:hypothetical protein
MEMSLRDDNEITGRLTLRMHDAEGRIVEERRANNAITFHGRELVGRLFNHKADLGKIPRVSRICVGGSGRAFNPRDTDLAAPVGCTPIATVEEVETTDAEGRPRMMLRLTGELGESDSNAELSEAGLFTAPQGDGDAGVMYNRVVFKPINKSAQFKLTLVWEITF